jgi:glycosyltransferase involved in cell wall biosynthesis
MNARVCFIGGARYGRPLDPTDKKKFSAMVSLGQTFVVGFSRGLLPRVFREHAHFYLLPELPLRVMRYLEMWVGGAIVALWIVLRHGVRIVVAQGPYEGLAAAAVKKLAGWFGCRISLVIEIHGDFENSFFLERRIRLAKPYQLLMRRAAQFSLAQADVLRAISSSTRQQLEPWAAGKTIVQFPAWTDIEAFLLAGRGAEERLHPRRILYAGVLTPLKGVHRLINAFARITGEFPGVSLTIVGRSENKDYADALRKQVSQLGLSDQVEFRQAMPQTELAMWMGNSAVVVLPSSSEGLGRVLVEAMATGTPVIGSEVGGIPDVIEDQVRGFLVPPDDEHALSEKLGWILKNPDQARAMGRRGRAFAEQFFSKEIYLDGYRQVFRAAQTMGSLEKNAAFDF